MLKPWGKERIPSKESTAFERTVTSGSVLSELSEFGPNLAELDSNVVEANPFSGHHPTSISLSVHFRAKIRMMRLPAGGWNRHPLKSYTP